LTPKSNNCRLAITRMVCNQARTATGSSEVSILRCVVFLKDKYTARGAFEKFKARLCVDGSRQDHAMYEDVSSPTATTTSVMAMAAVAAWEGRIAHGLDVCQHHDEATPGTAVRRGTGDADQLALTLTSPL